MFARAAITATPDPGASLASTERQIRNSVIYLVPLVVGAVLPLVTLPIFTRILTREDYGVLALANAYAACASGLANGGLGLSYERNFFQYASPQKRSALLYSTLAFVIAALAVVAYGTWWWRAELAAAITPAAAHGDMLFWAFCAAGVASLKGYYLTYCRNTHDATTYVRYTVDEHVLGVIGSLVFVAYLRVGVIGMVAGPLLASTLVLAALTIRFRRRLPWAFSRRLLLASLKLSYPLAPRLLLGVVAGQFDKYLIGRLGSLGGLGLYSIGQRVASIVFSVMTALENVFAPQVYERMFARTGHGEDQVGRYLTPFVYVSMGAALGLSLVAEEALRLLTPVAYHGAVAVVNVLVMFYAIMFFGKQPQLMFAKQTALISVLSVVGVAVNASLVMVGLHRWGTIGAAWGTLASGVVMVGLTQLVGHRYYPIRWEYRRLGAILGLFAASVILVMVMSAVHVDDLVQLGVKGVLAGAYLWLGIRLRLVSRRHLALGRAALAARWR